MKRTKLCGRNRTLAHVQGKQVVKVKSHCSIDTPWYKHALMNSDYMWRAVFSKSKILTLYLFEFF